MASEIEQLPDLSGFLTRNGCALACASWTRLGIAPLDYSVPATCTSTECFQLGNPRVVATNDRVKADS